MSTTKQRLHGKTNLLENKSNKVQIWQTTRKYTKGMCGQKIAEISLISLTSNSYFYLFTTITLIHQQPIVIFSILKTNLLHMSLNKIVTGESGKDDLSYMYINLTMQAVSSH